MESFASESSPADEVVDQLLPTELDWQRLVRRYPLAALALAAVGGWILGRHRGNDILQALSDFAADSVSEQVNELLGKNVV